MKYICWTTVYIYWVYVLDNTSHMLSNTYPRHMSNIYMGIYVLDNVFIYLGHISWTEFICIGVFLQYMYWVYVLECIYMYWTTMSRIVVRYIRSKKNTFSMSVASRQQTSTLDVDSISQHIVFRVGCH